jgi:hypothetical protein
VRLKSGGVAVFSPVALTPDVKKTVSSMGDLKYITAPDFEVGPQTSFGILDQLTHSQHHIFIGEWHKEYPNAKVIGVEGLPEKRAKQKNENVPFSTIFKKSEKGATKVDPEFDGEFDYEYVPSHPNKELVFCHKASRTLLVADYMCNLPATEQFSKTQESPTSGIFTRLFMSLTNTQGAALGQKRLLWYGLSVNDRPAFNASALRISGFDFDTIVPCHGDVIEAGGKGIFQKVFEWHIEAAKKEAQKSK